MLAKGICHLPLQGVGFPGSSAGKESACSARDLGSIPGLGRSPGEGTGYTLQYSGLENPMDCIVHGVTKSWIQLSDFHFFPWGLNPLLLQLLTRLTELRVENRNGALCDPGKLVEQVFS